MHQSDYPNYQDHHQQQQQQQQPPINSNSNPNFTPNSIDPNSYPQFPSNFASAPPDYPPQYSQFPDYTLNSIPTAPSFPPNPIPQFNYPHDHVPNPNVTVPYSQPQYSSYENDHNTVNYDRWGGDEGVYRYEGGKVEPYGARGTPGYSGLGTGETGSQVMFDDYGRRIDAANERVSRNDNGNGKVSKVVKAVPKVDTEEDDVRGGVQKFRVKLLAEGYGQTDLDVLCQIGLDGIRMLDPSTSKTLRIYPFETVVRWEVLDAYIFAFWAKMQVDIEPKRIRLKSSSYTTTTILDTVTAASVQLKEIAEEKVPNSSRTSEQLAEKKKGLVDWMNLMKPPNEEKEHWIPDEAVNTCTSCGSNFSAFVRRHHCRNCGEIFCDKCTQGRTPLSLDEEAPPVRVCDRCMGEVTQRLDNAKEASNRNGSLLSHEDLAKKLKEQMSRNSKTRPGTKFEGSEKPKREVECPTCTVHLQVEVPSSGSETIECSICQHPFLVTAD